MERKVVLSGIVFMLIGVLALIQALTIGSAAQVVPADLTRSEVIKLIAASPENGVNLQGVRLNDLDLFMLDLRNVRLVNADLQDTNLSRAVMINIEASGADFGGANIEFVAFFDAVLNYTNFAHSHLQGSSFRDAILVGADFSGANLTDVDFRDAWLLGANFEGATLTGAIMPGGEFYSDSLDLTLYTNELLP